MESRELFALLDTTGDAAFAVDPEGRICYWSPNAERLLGFPKEKALSKNCEEILSGEDEAGCKVCTANCHVLDVAWKKGQVSSFDLHAATAQGKRKWVSISIIVAHMRRGPSPLVVHLVRDIENRKQIENVTRNIVTQVGHLTGQQADEILHQSPAQPPAADLTPRELSILRLLSLGRSTEDIASQLHISGATVRNHVQHVLQKLECHTRLEAVVLAARRGLI